MEGVGLEERMETEMGVSFFLSVSKMAQFALWLYFAVNRSTCVWTRHFSSLL